MNNVHHERMKKMVKNRTLLLLAAMVWGAAGFNIARIGALAYPGNESLFHAAVSLVVFVLFWRMFHKLVSKHTARIKNFAREKQYFWRFFDKKSFLIMAFMMTGGISMRAFNLMPEGCIAMFYTGLGIALALAGLAFALEYVRYKA